MASGKQARKRAAQARNGEMGGVSHAGLRDNRGAESGLRSKTRREPLKDLEKFKNERDRQGCVCVVCVCVCVCVV